MGVGAPDVALAQLSPVRSRGIKGTKNWNRANPSTPGFAHSPSQIASPDKVVIK